MTTSTDATPDRAETTAPPSDGGSCPRLAEGVVLLGEYDGQGYRDAPTLARRKDGTVVQLHPLVFAVASSLDGQRDHEAIALRVRQETGTALDAANVERILDTKLRRLGLAALADGSSPHVSPADPLLALRLRAGVLPPGLVQRLTRLFTPLFHLVVVAGAVLALAAFDVWLFFVHGIAQGTRAAMQHPALFLAMLGMLLASAAFHELGHASGLRASGGRPGRMGAGIYLAWPAFFSDVTDAYRLPRSGRLRTDLGGIYFNALFVLALAVLHALSGAEFLLVVCLVMQLEIVHQLLPLLRLDSYYIGLRRPRAHRRP